MAVLLCDTGGVFSDIKPVKAVKAMDNRATQEREVR